MICALMNCGCIHILLYQLKVSEAISQRFKLLYISHDIYALLSHEILDVALGAYRGPQDFNALYRGHLWSEIIGNIPKGRVSPKEENVGPAGVGFFLFLPPCSF